MAHEAPRAHTDGLDEAQRAAVLQPPGGALFVLAGPGAGKTRVIVHRAAHLVAPIDAGGGGGGSGGGGGGSGGGGGGLAPESLCVVTYTIKAAQELKARLGTMVGEATARRIAARTLHGLGARLVRRFAPRLGLPPTLRIMDPAQRRRLLVRVIREEKLFASAQAGGLAAAAERAQRGLHALANAGVLPERALAFATSWAEGGPAAVPAPGEYAPDELLDLARLYSASTRRAWAQGLLTFDDLLLLPLVLFERDAQAATLARATLRELIVDEFQDCNPAQVALLAHLAPARAMGAGGPGLTLVGDDDQAIYAFRGADQHAFARARAVWPQAQVAMLDTNYRSTPAIVAVAQRVIGGARRRFVAEKALKAHARAEHADAPPVEVLSVGKGYAQAGVVAAWLLHQRRRHEAAQAGGPSRGVFRWGHHAVLVRTHAEAQRVEAALALEGVPARRARGSSLLDEPAVEDALAWMAWLANPRDSFSARRVLTRPPARIDPLLAGEWDRHYREMVARAGVRAANGGAAGDAPGVVSFAEFVRGVISTVPASVDAEQARSAQRVLDVYTELAARVGVLPADDAVMLVLQRTGVARAELLGARERARAIGAVARLLALAREKRALLDAPGDLRMFLRYLDELREADPTLRAFEQAGGGAAGEIEDAADASGASGDDESTDAGDAVAIVTAHSAKGLEFPSVVVMNVQPPHGFPKTGQDDDEPVLPAALQAEVVGSGAHPKAEDAAAQRADDALDEERRLFYVACTRAERRLVLCSPYAGAKTKSAQHFLAELWPHARALGLRIRTAQEVLGEAAQDGVVLLGSSSPEEAPLDADGVRRGLDELASRIRDAGRDLAARALEAAQAGELGPKQLATVDARLAHAARLVALAEAVRTTRRVPAWAREHADAQEPAGADLSLAAAVARCDAALRAQDDRVPEGGPDADGGAAPGAGVLVLPAPRAPLVVSYTQVQEFESCPRCWYVSHVLRVPGAPSPALALGDAVHRALQAFYERFREADAEGSVARPTLEELLAWGRSAVLDRALPLDPSDLAPLVERVEALLRAAYVSFHAPEEATLNVLEVEGKVEFSIEAAGAMHQVVAKLDRVDQLPDGALRVVDYKTGAAKKDLLEPKADDLQLGVYALALAERFTPEDVRGASFEYRLLASGQRGALAGGGSAIDVDAVRQRLVRAVEGMLAGRYAKGKSCRGTCAVMGAAD